MVVIQSHDWLTCRDKVTGSAQSLMGHCVTPYTARHRTFVRARGWGRLLWHDIFWLWQGQQAHQLTAAVVTSTQSNQTVLQDVKGRGSWGPPWAEELSVADNLWKKEFIFFNSDPWQLPMLRRLEPNCHKRWLALTGLSALETQMKTKLGRL